MAVTVVVTEYAMPGQRRHFRVVVSETNVSSASEWNTGMDTSNPKLPHTGTVTLTKGDLTAGTGTTFQPKLGRAATPTANTIQYFGQVSAAAAFINDATPLRYDNLTTGILYGMSMPNSAVADHTITTEFTVVEGHF